MPKKKKEMLVCFVLDETGSMLEVKEETIIGFNEYIKTLKKRKENVLFSLTTFNSSCVKLVHKEVKIGKVSPLTDETYRPNFFTPLYDAIGQTIRGIEKEPKRQVLFVIMTDGEENASKEFSQKGVFDLITEKTKAGWTFVFLGANQDAWRVGQSIGITAKANTLTYDVDDMKQTMRSVSTGTACYLATDGKQTDKFFNG